jgi:hypothetical protein
MDDENGPWLNAARAFLAVYRSEDIDSIIAPEEELVRPPPFETLVPPDRQNPLDGLQQHIIGSSDPPGYLDVTLK